MVLDSKIAQLQFYFGIAKPEDWCDVRPEWILRQDGIGPVTLEHIRIYLAARDLTLKDDRTPEYWKQNLSSTKIGQAMGHPELGGQDTGQICPFSVIVDTAEQFPFGFVGLRTDADKGNRPIIVPIERQSLGRHPDSLGDYSLTGGIGRCHVERKSLDDAHGTILGFNDGRRERFEKELENLSAIEAGCVVVECSFEELIARAPTTKKSAAVNAKMLLRSVISFQQSYRCHWHFAGNRRLAETYTFRWLERWWKKQADAAKAAKREAALGAAKERAEVKLFEL